ncbi:MAG TPA: hypothetical protein VJ974_09305 [Geopsychrobacteraceae bacterium]|nr:hypothetical protein [Geopsychrobacteraceae bacterium]
MIVGFNHNMTHRGICFHVQTEDSGIKTPHLITLLYHGGTIITSQKTSYADILNVDNLEAVIEDLAKEQHKGMLRRLKKGEFDQRIIEYGIKITPLEQAEKPEASSVEATAQASSATAPEMVVVKAGSAPAIDFPEPEDISLDDAERAYEEKLDPEKNTDLDDLIFSYLTGDEEKE